MTPRQRGQSGSLLVITLWLIVILSVLAVAIGRYLSLEVRITKYRLAREEAKVLARSGVYLAMQRLAQDAASDPSGKKEEYDWLGDEWAYVRNEASPETWVVPLEGGDRDSGGARRQLTIHIEDEERAVSLNAEWAEGKDQALLWQTAQGVLDGVGVADPIGVAAAIRDYQDSDKGADDPGIAPPEAAKNAPIRAIEELWDIPFINQLDDAKLEETLRTQTTVWTDGSININTATEPVLIALFARAFPDDQGGRQRGDALARAILDFRWDPDDGGDRAQGDCFVQLGGVVSTKSGGTPGQVVESDLPWVMSGDVGNVLVVSSNYFTVRASGEVSPEGTPGQPSVRYEVEAVVHRGVKEDPKIELRDIPFRVLAWREG